jgi:hypothetical protein
VNALDAGRSGSRDVRYGYVSTKCGQLQNCEVGLFWTEVSKSCLDRVESIQKSISEFTQTGIGRNMCS